MMSFEDLHDELEKKINEILLHWRFDPDRIPSMRELELIQSFRAHLDKLFKENKRIIDPPFREKGDYIIKFNDAQWIIDYWRKEESKINGRIKVPMPKDMEKEVK